MDPLNPSNNVGKTCFGIQQVSQAQLIMPCVGSFDTDVLLVCLYPVTARAYARCCDTLVLPEASFSQINAPC